ncbi:hypothetical protein UCDDS831_g02457 [Diplodia seriata]|uniref:Uncharacterized protein n=1 Tax=Diplodia seriata TaxID=420778 RepID=A0A0G2EQ61_9PEZI|nr:hypothetical protein UCDDS831_g02457 [Diplodia seriata]
MAQQTFPGLTQIGLAINYGQFPGTIARIPESIKGLPDTSLAFGAFKAGRYAQVEQEDQEGNPRRLLIFTDASKTEYSKNEFNFDTMRTHVVWYCKLGIAVGWQEKNRTTGRMDWKEKTQDMTHRLLRGTWLIDRCEFEAVKMGIANVALPFYKGLSPNEDERGHRIGEHVNPWVADTGPNITEVALYTDSDNALTFIDDSAAAFPNRQRAWRGAEFALSRLNTAADEMVSQGVAVELNWTPRNAEAFGIVWVDCWAKIARGANPWGEYADELRYRKDPHWRLWWNEMRAQGRGDEFDPVGH